MDNKDTLDSSHDYDWGMTPRRPKLTYRAGGIATPSRETLINDDRG